MINGSKQAGFAKATTFDMNLVQGNKTQVHSFVDLTDANSAVEGPPPMLNNKSEFQGAEQSLMEL